MKPVKGLKAPLASSSRSDIFLSDNEMQKFNNSFYLIIIRIIVFNKRYINYLQNVTIKQLEVWKMDVVDLKILEELKLDSRVSDNEISQKIGKTEWWWNILWYTSTYYKWII